MFCVMPNPMVIQMDDQTVLDDALESNAVVDGDGSVVGGTVGLSDVQFAAVEQHLESIDYTNGAILASLNLGFVVLAATLIFIVFWKIFDIAFGR